MLKPPSGCCADNRAMFESVDSVSLAMSREGTWLRKNGSAPGFEELLGGRYGDEAH